MSGTTAGALVDALVPVLAAAMLCAGLTKLAVPRPTRAALVELAPRSAPVAGFAVRLLALAETAAAIALLVPPVRTAGAAAATALGAVFAGAGLVGWVRHATAPCGCYGRVGGAPLGLRNVILGVLVAALGTALWSLDGRGATAGAATLASATAVVTCLLVAALYQRLIRIAVRPIVTTAP